IPSDANGAIDVAVNPLVANQLGIRHDDGWGTSLFASGDVGPSPWLAMSGAARASTFGTSQKGFVDQLYARVQLRNVAVTVGRDYVFFGHGQSAGLLNSLNPHGFDLLRVSGDRPFLLPFIARLLGPVQGT